ncbi:MAG TPA: bifunctional demethylmenaquinone methyltransferase/2-methoxy-6-polyprenyl-1,4-benzoquinol methylase UbiE [Bryobacteraceae bacterium]|nr:bifunctional demethylmenaquinone methyltransferase/2-methoxy-6-polyprenyl-1,4-benzoquinol methylase UbiE [Bryobacteraceae bacterium]
MGITKGTTPVGTQSEEQASRWVRQMFGAIAPRYDLLNHLLSFNLDRYWRSRTIRRISRFPLSSDSRVLDICCGTGDLTIALGLSLTAAVYGSDFCHPMLVAARPKLEARHLRPLLFEADALHLPIADHSLDVLAVAFGFRNLANYDQGLAELRRVMKPGGIVAILEFSIPPNKIFAALYRFYFTHILPFVGGLISGSHEAYSYLPESVRKFPGAPELANRMLGAGFARVEFEQMTGGIVAVHVGTA